MKFSLHGKRHIFPKLDLTLFLVLVNQNEKETSSIINPWLHGPELFGQGSAENGKGPFDVTAASKSGC